MAKRKNLEALQQGAEDSSSAKDSAIDTRTQKRVKKTAVEHLNALDAAEFQECLVDNDSLGFDNGGAIISLYFAKDLPLTDFDACFNLIETTSRHDYEPSSFGWHPKRKRREMKEKEMRYLIVKKGRQFLGFLSFMLTHDSTPVVPVAYIYEIHLTEEARGKGLGQHLVEIAEDVAKRAGMDKVMLTCFLSNTKAHSFYERLGYSADECSPEDRQTRNKTVKVDYVIMSKDLRQATSDENDTAIQVIQDESTNETISSDEANGLISLDECEVALRAWTQEHKAKEILDEGLVAADSARTELCLHNSDAATEHRDVLAHIHRFLHSRYEAARDLSEVLREQTYHLKSQISDVDRLAEIMESAVARQERPLAISQAEDGFDMEKSTEQIYSAFFTLMRKAEEVDTRLDDVADREDEVSLLEYDLNQREEELDDWEADLHEREKALAEREERLARSKTRLTRRAGRAMKSEQEESLDVLWKKRGPPPIVKVNDWLLRSRTPDEECPARTIDEHSLET